MPDVVVARALLAPSRGSREKNDRTWYLELVETSQNTPLVCDAEDEEREPSYGFLQRRN